jgi:hypothetical protein
MRLTVSNAVQPITGEEGLHPVNMIILSNLSALQLTKTKYFRGSIFRQGIPRLILKGIERLCRRVEASRRKNMYESKVS